MFVLSRYNYTLYSLYIPIVHICICTQWSIKAFLYSHYLLVVMYFYKKITIYKMITKNKLVTLLEAEQEKNKANDFYFRGDYHDIGYSELSDIIDMIEDDEEYSDSDEVIDALQYNGSITEYADSGTPIYYSDIAKWFGENWSAVDEYCDEFGDVAQDSHGKADIMKTIQWAYCMTYERDLQEALKNFIEELPEEEEEADKEAEEVTTA